MAEAKTPGDEVPPLDDGGINNDHILDLCDYIINNMWKQYIEKRPAKSPTLAHMKDMSQTLFTVWGLVQEILNLDRRLREQVESGEVEEEFFEKFDGFPPKTDDDDEEDWGEEEDDDDDDETKGDTT